MQARIQIETLTHAELKLLVHALSAYNHNREFEPLHRRLAEQLDRHDAVARGHARR